MWTREQKTFYETHRLVLSDQVRNVYKDTVTGKEELKRRSWETVNSPSYMSSDVIKTCKVLGWEVHTLDQLKQKMGIA